MVGRGLIKALSDGEVPLGVESRWRSGTRKGQIWPYCEAPRLTDSFPPDLTYEPDPRGEAV
jgi:hypothetical protein